MKQIHSSFNEKQLDSYSALITSKYLKTTQDFVNLICVNSKFQKTTEKLRYNPIPIKSLALFPKIQTQYLYSEKDIKIDGIDNYEILYEVNYDQYLKYKKDNIKCHLVIYTQDNRKKHGNIFFSSSNIFSDDDSIFTKNESHLTKINLSSTITKLGENCFRNCTSVASINLPITIQSMGESCFCYCRSLISINLPLSLKELSSFCFSECISLKSINLPSTITSLGAGCFSGCSSLTSINLPSTIKEFGDSCFYGCSRLNGKIKVPDKCFYKPWWNKSYN